MNHKRIRHSSQRRQSFITLCKATFFALAIKSSTALAIVGGLPISDDVPGSASVIRFNLTDSLDNKDSCAGVLLSKNAFVTAAHCTEDFGMGNKMTIEDPDSGQRPRLLILGEPVHRHPNYRMGFNAKPMPQESRFDIAVVKTRNDISTLFAHPRFAKLTSELQHLEGEELMLVSNGQNTPRFVRNANPPNLFIKITELRRDFFADSQSRNSDIMAYKSSLDGTGVCVGDSGGGIFLSREPDLLYGIQSTKFQKFACGDPHDIAFFAPIKENLSWILALIGSD